LFKRVRKEHAMEDFGERTTGTRDEHYNLISVLYHALHGADNCDHYAMDAEASGDERLGSFFREAQAAQVQIAERGKELLGIVQSAPEFDAAQETSSSRGSGVPPTTEVPPGAAPGGTQRGTEPDVPPRMDFPPGQERPPASRP